MLLIVIVLIHGAAGLYGQEQAIQIEGADSLKTFSDPEIGQRYFELSGDVRLELKDEESGTLHRIHADYILFNRERKTLSARGNVIYDLVREGVAEQFIGDSLVFNTGTWAGTFFSGESSRIQNLEDKTVTFYYSGKEIERFEDGSVVIMDGTISSSGIKEPYYRIEAEQISILRPGEWAVKDATFYLGRIPIIPLPFFFMPGDKLFLNPSFGFNNTKGYFLQTTTYLKGKAPQDRDAGFSFMQYLDSDPSRYTLEREGLFLVRKPLNGDKEEHDDYVKVIADYYTLLGSILAVEGKLETAGPWRDISFFSGLAGSRTIMESPGFGYTALLLEDGEYRADWQESHVLGTALPFRFGAEFSGTLPISSAFQLTADLPFYSDPSMPSVFFPRKEGMQWKKFIDPDEVLEEDEQERGTLVPLIGIRSTKAVPVGGSESVSFKLDKLEVRSTIASSSSGESGLYPLSYYYPDTLVLPDISFTLNSTLFDTFRNNERKAAPPEDPEQGSFPDPPAPWTSEKPLENEQRREGYRPPEALPPEHDANRTRIELFRNSLGLSIQPKYTMQNAYNVVGKDSPETVSLEPDYSYQRLGGSAALNYFAVFGDRFISLENRTLFSGNYQEHTVISSYVEEDFGEDSDLAASRYDITSRYSATLRPFQAQDLWEESRLVHEINGVLLSGRWESSPESSFNTVPISWSDESITSHRLTTSLVRKESYSRQSISMALQLPPKELSIQPELLLEGRIWQLSGKELIRFPDDIPYYEQMFWRFTILPAEWVSFEEKLSLAMDTDYADLSESAFKISFFEEKLKTQHSWVLNLTDSELESYKSSLRIFPLYANYLAKREYNYTLKPYGWERDESDFRFRPYSVSTGLLFKYEPDPFWKRRVNLSLSLDSGWEMNLIRYSENHFKFGLAFNLSIAEFLDLEFASVSSNNLTYRYFDVYSSSGLEPINILTDLLDSFAFFDRARREQSSFNLESISIKAVHSMRDWDLNFVYKGKPILQNEENGTPFYRWQPEFSIFLQWRPIPEIKKEISYRKEEFEW
jgi:hypothetical protein